MSGNTFLQRRQCPCCGFTLSEEEDPPALFHKRWHVRGPDAVRAFVDSLSQKTHEWLLAIFVDQELNLLGVETVARGGVSGVVVPMNKIVYRADTLRASAFILVHNHPSGDPNPSESDIRITRRLRRMSEEMNLPLLDHLIIAGGQMTSVA